MSVVVSSESSRGGCGVVIRILDGPASGTAVVAGADTEGEPVGFLTLSTGPDERGESIKAEGARNVTFPNLGKVGVSSCCIALSLPFFDEVGVKGEREVFAGRDTFSLMIGALIFASRTIPVG